MTLTSVQTATNLESMIEDCLLEIFSFKSLTVMDFCSVAETCRRFQQIVQRRIPKRIHISDCLNGVYDVRWQHLSRKYTESEIERVLNNFASVVRELRLADFETPHLVKLVFDKYGCNLAILKIYDSFIPEMTTTKLTKLTKLQLEDVVIAPNASFARLTSLVELRMARVRNGKAVLLNYFPRLKYFTYNGSIRRPRTFLFTKWLARLYGNRSKVADSSKVLVSFLQCNRTLKTINLILDDFADKDLIVLKEIVNSCRQTDVLRVNCGKIVYTDFIEPIKSSRCRGYLELSESSCKYVNIFSHASFRSLCLYNCDLPQPGQFSSLAHLTKLELEAFQSPLMLDVVGIIGQLIYLEVLNINLRLVWYGAPFILDEETFENIVDVVKGRQHILTMRCKTKFCPRGFDLKQKIRLLRLRPTVLY